uniref:Capsid protein n=1 Tax=Cressdnaviricota sp. TaxID=2748378 RepID=A0A4D6J020_9VIRU|nr:capsid protein [Cressdnaviricota sp.]
MVTVRVSETYDLSTKQNKMGIVGIHTPRGALISSLWGGLLQNHKMMRYVSCDVSMACASMLPADPLQIGVDAGDIAPQDMFNPILYKAVSNDSMSNLQAWLMSVGVANAAVDKNSVIDVNDTQFKFDDGVAINQFEMYYALLSDSDAWKKAMPQAGLQMKGLFPIVHEVVYNMNADDMKGLGYVQNPTYPGSQDGTSTHVNLAGMRGRALRMPAFPTIAHENNGNIKATPEQSKMDCYVAVIVLPPAKLNQLYYRLKVTWTIEFTGLRALTDINNWRYLANTGYQSYATDYATQSGKMSALEGMVDTDGASIEKIMEGST